MEDTGPTPAVPFLSWAPEVIADETGTWLPNGLRFATEAEARGYNDGLFLRWTAVRDTREVPHADPVKNLWHPKTGLSFLPETSA
jgi:hypothetical protein